jgi:two-component system cell cycle sensor histidine kinase/response regulator CckA
MLHLRPLGADASSVEKMSAWILIVDDDDSILKLVDRGLRQVGYQTLTARTGIEAVELASGMERLDLLIADVNVPGKGGRELAAQVAAFHPAARVLYISGFSRETVGDEGIVTDSASFLAKPFTIPALAEAVANILNR